MPTKIEKDSVTGRETTGHEWDGLKELNTPLPKWWLYTFYACIVVAFGQFLLYPSIPYRHRLFPRHPGLFPARRGRCGRGGNRRAAEDVDGQDRRAVVRRHQGQSAVAGSRAGQRQGRVRNELPAVPRRRRRRAARLSGAGGRRLDLGRHAGGDPADASRTASAPAMPTHGRARCRASAPTPS